MLMETIKVLDHGYVRHIESYGHGDSGMPTTTELFAGDVPDMECGIIEAARQSTQANFRSWKPYHFCTKCEIWFQRPPTSHCSGCDDGKHDLVEYKNGDQGLLNTLYLNEPQHATPFEFSGMVIETRVPIFVRGEWHRHRTQSYNEMSARYAPLPAVNYLPTVERCMRNSKTNKQAGTLKGADELTEGPAQRWLNRQEQMYKDFEFHYQEGLKIGIPKEIARIGMPVGRYTQFRAVANLRNWLAFLTLRDDPGAQWEIQQFAKAVGQIIEQQFPLTYALWLKKKSPEFRISKFTDGQLIEELRRRGWEANKPCKEDVR